MRVMPGEAIGQRGNRQRPSMGGHMPAVSDQGHGAIHMAADDLRDHHQRGKRHDEPGPAFILVVAGAEEDVAVLPQVKGTGMHESLLSAVI
jgi:hypothetical protein